MTYASEIPDDQLDRFLRAEFTKRARRALKIYRAKPLIRDAPGYPFAQRPEDGSIRSPRASSITPLPRGVRIAVQSRGAPFLEEGNDARGRYIEAPPKSVMALPLKASAPGVRKAKRSKRGRSGSVVIGKDGKAYLLARRVRTYRGRHQLRRSVEEAFGLR